MPITFAPPSSSPPAGADGQRDRDVCGEPLAPAAVIVTSPVYVPAARPAVATDTVTFAGAVPLAGATDSHAASSDAV